MITGNKVLLIDDHPIVRAGLAQLLEGAGYKVAGQACNRNELLTLIKTVAADLAVLDLALDGESGLGLITLLKSRNFRVLVYTMHGEPYTVNQAVTAGADGFVTKRETAQSLLAGVAAVLRGETYWSPRADAVLSMAAPVTKLAGQQLRIYQLMGQGMGNEGIAKQLNISIRTLESYCARIIDKLGAANMRELRQKAINDAVKLDE